MMLGKVIYRCVELIIIIRQEAFELGCDFRTLLDLEWGTVRRRNGEEDEGTGSGTVQDFDLEKGGLERV